MLTVQALFPASDESAHSVALPEGQGHLAWFADHLGSNDPALTLPAPTIAQVSYWRELCGVDNGAGKHGVADDEWPADQMPSRSTLRALEESSLLVRRYRDWQVRRDWYMRLSALQLRAVPTPPLEALEALGEGLPTYRAFQACEQIARWLDAQPKRDWHGPELPELPHLAPHPGASGPSSSSGSSVPTGGGEL